MTGLNHRATTRVTSQIDRWSGKPLVVRLEQGGFLVRVKPLGCRTWFTVTVMQLFQYACETKVRLEQAEKRRRREERKALRRELAR